jgi:transcriptional regulator with XRE-family HTH domain
MPSRSSSPAIHALGPRLAAAREGARLTQAQLAEILGIRSPETISRYERGEREPRFSSLCRLASALGISVDDLLDASPPARPSTVAAPRRGPRAAADRAVSYPLGASASMGRSHAALWDAARRDMQRLHDVNPDAALLALGQIVELIDAALRRAAP